MDNGYNEKGSTLHLTIKRVRTKVSTNVKGGDIASFSTCRSDSDPTDGPNCVYTNSVKK